MSHTKTPGAVDDFEPDCGRGPILWPTEKPITRFGSRIYGAMNKFHICNAILSIE
jgi:hypothetical protein